MANLKIGKFNATLLAVASRCIKELDLGNFVTQIEIEDRNDDHASWIYVRTNTNERVGFRWILVRMEEPESGFGDFKGRFQIQITLKDEKRTFTCSAEYSEKDGLKVKLPNLGKKAKPSLKTATDREAELNQEIEQVWIDLAEVLCSKVSSEYDVFLKGLEWKSDDEEPSALAKNLKMIVDMTITTGGIGLEFFIRRDRLHELGLGNTGDADKLATHLNEVWNGAIGVKAEWTAKGHLSLMLTATEITKSNSTP